MSALDVEALLDSTADNAAETKRTPDRDDRNGHDDKSEKSDQRRDSGKDLKRSRREKAGDGDEEMKSPKSDSHRSKRRSRSRSTDRDRHSSRRERSARDSDTPDDKYHSPGGDYYRGGGRTRSRSRSPPGGDRYYRPHDGDRRDRDNDRHNDRYRERERDRDRDRDRHRDNRRGARGANGGRRRTPSPRKGKTPEPQLTEDERDRRTVFVQQLAARLRTKELITFFEKVGPVKEAQIVKDRVSGRSKGVGYVEFKDEESVPGAIQLTGQKLLGIPIIAQLTEAEKNRQARNGDGNSSGTSNSVPFHRLYVGNIHFSITESDLQNVFEPFGELEFVTLQKEEQGRSRGYGFVQFRDPNQAREALEKMNGFELAGRPIRVGLGNDKFTPESTANLLHRFQGQNQNFQGSAFSGHGGRGSHAGGSGGNFDRAGGRDNDKGQGGASALDDTDVAGVNFSNYSRDALMRKLARTDEPSTDKGSDPSRKAAAKPKPEPKQLPVDVGMASRCVVLRNMFDPSEEEGEAWIKELEDDVRAECEEKYGHVVHIALDPNTQGDIYLKFDRVQGGENAIKGLNGRFFGGRRISAQPVVDAVYGSLFQRAKAL